MPQAGYNQFCPVSMAAEIVCSRWTLLLLRELCLGASRFNELRRGVPRMSPALLSSRLKDLEGAGIVRRRRVVGASDVFEYQLTEAGQELRPIIEAVGVWGQRWVSTEATLKNLDADLLMWDIRRNISTEPMPRRRVSVEFEFPERPAPQRNYWLIVEPGEPPDVCKTDPGFDVDLYISTDLRTMTEIWLGYTTISGAKDEGRLVVTGAEALQTNLRAWLKLSVFANVQKRAS